MIYSTEKPTCKTCCGTGLIEIYWGHEPTGEVCLCEECETFKRSIHEGILNQANLTTKMKQMEGI
jgi:hypothetical protein